MTSAWVFPGQGSQKVGMVADLIDHPLGAERFALAAELLGRDLAAICRGEASGLLSDLDDTRNTQPALFLVEATLVDLLRQQGRRAELLAGHSLGELVALYAAGCFDFATGLALVRQRSELMAAVGDGAMTAVMGFDRAELESLVAASDAVVIANDNSRTQVVISGSPTAVARVGESLRCRRAIPLAVSGAFHSPWMAEPAAAFAATLATITFAAPETPVISNASASATADAAALKANLTRQMTTPVRWRETMDRIAAAGIDTVVEIGPGTVLSGLFKRSTPGVGLSQIGSVAALGL
ncbi:MAG: ACP S-malonyltransferase [Aphanocapsa feldmannii 277cV]|uniref:Malonyl CoA-acyl carrier protein transacylase n=3 Tax=Aphanocapsa feldmannii TaxID=192050 RepID=A0A524RNC5_9CHRO|nr:MAG: ACP S-malonyltransferase [Aphanocapsa feldmannii 277cV]